MAEDQSFVRRWSQRKASARRKRRQPLAGAASDGAGDRIDAGPQTAGATPPAGDDVPATAGGAPQPVAIEDLPDIDSMSAESDFTVFLRDGVPETLRRAALRRLWQLDPVFANLDGLLEYGEDYTDAATAVENLTTAYRIGRGFIDDGDEGAEAAIPPEAPAAGDSAAGSVDRTTTQSETADQALPADGASSDIGAAETDAENLADRSAGCRCDATAPGGESRRR